MPYRIKTHSRRVALLTLLILAVGTPRADAQGAKPPTGSRAGIFGHVYSQDEKTKALTAIPGATIELLQGGKVVGQATSNARGYYSIEQLSAGAAYHYRVTATGYRDEDSGRGFELNLTEGDAPQDFTMQKGANDPNAKKPEMPTDPVGHLCGQVYEKTPAGEWLGVNGAEVYLRKIGTTKLKRVIVNPPTDGKSSSGYYANLEAGQWQIIVQADGFDPPPPAIVDIVADQMADPKDLFLTRPAHDSHGTGSLVRRPTPADNQLAIVPGSWKDPAFSGGGGLSRYEPKQTGDGGVTKFVPTYQGLSGTITLADATSGNTTPIRVGIRRAADRADVPSTPVQLDAQGAYKIDRPPGRYTITAEADGYLPAQSSESEVLAGSYKAVNLKLERRPAELLVKVYDAETKLPLGDATLRKRRPNEALGAASEMTDATGQFTFKAMPAGEFQVLATMTGYKAGGAIVTLGAGKNETLEISLTRDAKPATLIVSVHDAENPNGLVGVNVQVTPIGGKGLDPSTTDSKGSSKKVDLAKPGTFKITVSKTGYIDQERTVALEAGDNSQTFDLQHVKSLEPKLTLIAIDAKKGTPLEGVSLNISPALPNGAALKTDAQGSFESKLPKTGRYTIELTKPGYETATDYLNAVAGDNTRRVPLSPVMEKPPNRLIVYVVEASNTNIAIPGVRVLLRPTTDASSKFEGTTNATGKEIATPLTLQTYILTVEKDSYEPKNVEVVLPPGDTSKIVSLAKKAVPVKVEAYRLALQILLYGGDTPIAGADIKVERVEKADTSASDGVSNFVVPGEGKYNVTVTKTGYEPSTTLVNVNYHLVKQKIYLRPVVVEAAKRTINVLVREAGRNGTFPIDGAKVKILNAKQEVVLEGITNELGRFPAKNLEAGIYTIEATKGDFTQREKVQSDIRLRDDQPEVPLYRDMKVVIEPKKIIPPIVEVEVAVPNVVTLDLQTAQTTIQNARLVFQPAYADARALTGKASSQQPAAGTKVKQGTKVIVIFTVPNEAPKIADTYAAIVYSEKTGKWGCENRQTTRELAERSAQQECKAADAKVAVWVKNGYCAIVWDENYAWGVGFSTDQGASAAAAKKMALDEFYKVSKSPPNGGLSIGSKDMEPVLFDFGNPKREFKVDPAPKVVVAPKNVAPAQERYTIDVGGSFERTGQTQWVGTSKDGIQLRLEEVKREKEGFIILYEAPQKRYYSIPIAGGNLFTRLENENNWTTLPLKLKKE